MSGPGAAGPQRPAAPGQVVRCSDATGRRTPQPIDDPSEDSVTSYVVRRPRPDSFLPGPESFLLPEPNTIRRVTADTSPESPAARPPAPLAVQGQAPDRNLALELVRVTEAAALAAGRWVGRGDKNGADQAAVDAMRRLVGTVSMAGVVVIGEGEKDEAPMLYNGEEVGDGHGPECDVAVDPVDGTTLTAKGMNNAIAVMAVSERGTMYDASACFYMEKLVCGPEAANQVDIGAPAAHNIEAVARAKGIAARDVTVAILERDRHDRAGT